VDPSEQLETVHEWAREMLTGRLAPIDGARRIAGAAGRTDDERRRFAELVAAWDAGERDEVADRILEEASLLVADTA
jgi:hypothetical protein